MPRLDSLVLALVTVLGLAAATVARAQVVVEKVEPIGRAAASGVQVGDTLLNWSRPMTSMQGASAGRFESAFDLTVLEIAEAPLAPVTLTLTRDGTSLDVTLPPGHWGLLVRPRLDAPHLDRFSDAQRRATGGQLDEAVALLRPIADAVATERPADAAWLLQRAALWQCTAGRQADCDATYANAVGLAAVAAAAADGPTLHSIALHLQADQLDPRLDRRSRSERALPLRRRALALLDPSARTLLRARLVADIGYELSNFRDPAAKAALDEADAILNDLAPGSLPHAHVVVGLVVVARQQADVSGCLTPSTRSTEIYVKSDSGSLDHARALRNLGTCYWTLGDPVNASASLTQAIEISERLEPSSEAVAGALITLGLVAVDLGDLAAAEEHYRRALAIVERLAPNTFEVADLLNNLGNVAIDRWDLEAAEAYHGRALGLRERLAPESLVVAMSLNNLGNVAIKAGNLVSAEQRHRRSLEIRRRIAPDSLNETWALVNLGRTLHLQGRLSEAEGFLRRAMEIRVRDAPGGLNAATAMHDLAAALEEMERTEEALGLQRQSLDIRTRLAPLAMGTASSAAAVGRLERALGRPAAALPHFERAVAILESQQERLGGVTEDRVSFRAHNMNIYRDPIDLLVERGREAEAYHLLEGSRAHGLLLLLAERDLLLGGLSPALEEERRRIAAEYDRTQQALARLSEPSDGARIAELNARLTELRDARSALRKKIATGSPQAAAVRYPEPLDLAGARATLDPGTALVAYSIGERTSLLFALDLDGALHVERLDLGRERLEAEVRAFRDAIARSPVDPAAAAEARRLGAQLYAILLAPAEAAWSGAQRLLIVPDAALHVLPFGALVRPGVADRGDSHLIESMPLHIAASVTVYRELRRIRPDPPPLSLVAFGDPRYATADMIALPGTRDEVIAIAALFGDRAQTFLGVEATEDHVKSKTRRSAVVHLAAHAVLDEKLPLDSAIVLTTPEVVEPGRNNGLLQAWEIFEQLRLDADLVTLSACETGLGKELAGEGIIGLTRAFQYAGARSVLASLWNVSDRRTADMMTRFYSHLQQGMSKDAALRAAQLEAIRGTAVSDSPADTARGVGKLAKSDAPSVTSPFYWAAFQLYGDWR